jgi:hypothetical protein
VEEELWVRPSSTSLRSHLANSRSDLLIFE